MRFRPLLAMVTALALSSALAVTPAGAVDPPPGTVTGVVLAPDGVTTVDNARVAAVCRPGPYFCPSSMSGPDGTFTLTNVPWDVNLVTASPPWTDETSFTGSTAIVVSSGGTTPTSVRLLSGGTASGRVLEPDGITAVPNGTRVQYYSAYPGGVRQAQSTTGDGGTYNSPLLQPGTLTVTAGPSSIGTMASSAALSLAESQPLPVADLLLVGGGGWIEGTVTGGVVGALEGAWVSPLSFGAPGVRTDGSGAYRTLAMPVAGVTVSVQPPSGTNFIGTTRSVAMVPGANHLDVDLVLGGIITGAVFAADGSPVASGMAQACVDFSTCFSSNMVSFFGGSYTIAGLAAGTYQLKVWIGSPPTGTPIQQSGIAVSAGHTTIENVSFASGGIPPATTSSVSAFVPENGSVTTLGEPSADNQVVTGIASPVEAQIEILEAAITQAAPSGITFLGQQVNIDLNGATTTPEAPFVFTFTLDASAIGANDPESIVVYRNGEPVADCTHATAAVPQPCVASLTPTTTVPPGAVLVVRTTEASPWNYSASVAPPPPPPSFTVTGFFSPVDSAGINGAKAGRTIPLKFSLAGDWGLDVLALASPSSVAVECADGTSPTDASLPASGALSYDAITDRYTWHWATNSTWRGCRRLDLTVSDGTLLSAVFRFR